MRTPHIPPPPARCAAVLVAFAALLAMGCEDGAPGQDPRVGDPEVGATIAIAGVAVDCEHGYQPSRIDLRYEVTLFHAYGERGPAFMLGHAGYRFVEMDDLRDDGALVRAHMDVDWQDGDRVIAELHVSGDRPRGDIELSETRELVWDAAFACWWDPARDGPGDPAPCRDSADVLLEDIDLRAAGSQADDQATCSARFGWTLWIQP